MTGRAVFGDFVHAARRNLGSAADLRWAANQGCDIREVSHSLLRVVVTMGRYVQDVSTMPRRVPSQEKAELSTWDRAGLEARNALSSATVLLHGGDNPILRRPGSAGSSEVARRLDAAWVSLAAGRDLLQTHAVRALTGRQEPRSEWWPVIISPPVTRAMLTEMALLARQIAPLGASIDLSPKTRGSPEARRRLNAACEWLHILDASIRTAYRHEPVSMDGRELLHAVPINRPPPRRLPDGSELVTSLCEGVIAAAERARHAAWTSTAVPPRSPTMTVSSLRQVAAASTLTSHHCDILLRSLAARTADDGPDELGAGLLQAADAAGRASRSWLSVAHALDDVTTDTQGDPSRAAAGASDLALWTGRLAYADPQWTLASGPSHEARPPQSLAPEPDDVAVVVAAAHHACDAVTRFAYADREQIRAAAGAERILVATQAPPDILDVPIPFVPAPPDRIHAILTLYEYTGTASAETTDRAADAATAVRAPSRVLATARSAVGTGGQDDRGTASHAADPPATREPRDPPGPVERKLHGLGVTSRDLLRRGAEIDRAGEQLIIEAAAEHEPRHSRQCATRSRQPGTTVLGAYVRASCDLRPTALQHGQASLQREPPEAES